MKLAVALVATVSLAGCNLPPVRVAACYRSLFCEVSVELEVPLCNGNNCDPLTVARNHDYTSPTIIITGRNYDKAFQ